MSTKFYTLLTDIGAAKLASAAALGVPLKITHMAARPARGTPGKSTVRRTTKQTVIRAAVIRTGGKRE